jgi:predicted lipoprotein with Yx(FWY)xxD motif
MAPGALLAVVAVVGVAVGVWGVAARPAAAAGSTVMTATNPTFGTILTNGQGFALYTYANDHNGMSSCAGSCAAVWPAQTVPAGTTPTAGPGVTGTVAAVLQSNGTYQVTYNGSPLYTFVSDSSPGQVSGNGVGGFSVVQVTAPPPPPPTTQPPTPTTAPAPNPATTSAPGPSAPRGAATGASNPSSATAPATSPSPPAGSATPAGGPGLASTGPGPALMWTALAGATLIGVSLLLRTVARPLPLRFADRRRIRR